VIKRDESNTALHNRYPYIHSNDPDFDQIQHHSPVLKNQWESAFFEEKVQFPFGLPHHFVDMKRESVLKRMLKSLVRELEMSAEPVMLLVGRKRNYERLPMMWILSNDLMISNDWKGETKEEIERRKKFHEDHDHCPDHGSEKGIG